MNPTGLLIISLSTLFPAYQLFTLPNISDQTALFSQYLGLAALILMAWGQILSTRISGIEALFGGLDRVYVLHKWAGILAMVALLLHDTIDADMRGLGRGNALNELAETLGEISLYGLLILVVLSIATFIPYHLWKWTHKAMGALFLAGAFHFAFILKPFAMSDPAGLYTGLFCITGLLAYVWMLLPETMRPSYGYRITDIDRQGDTVAISMTPQKSALRPRPGQFGVFRFTGANKSEPHPFSFSRIDDDGTLRITVKALGDFTASLPQTIATGQELRVQGPFGRFCRKGNRSEIWIAAGIGVTPFVTWAADLSPEDPDVDMFYCVKSRDSAAHLTELEQFAAAKPNLRLHVVASSEGNRLDADMIGKRVSGELSNTAVSYCGPVSLREDLRKGLRTFGVGPRNFHYEEFEFRTGIGLKALAHWVMTRSMQKSAENRTS